MIDTLSPAHRSHVMGRIRGKDTKPEMVVRQILYRLGYRYRLHARALPGSPDIVFHGRRKAIFVHGCFWHWHVDEACKIARVPKSRTEYWAAKLTRNRNRDYGAIEALQERGWQVLTIWE